MRRPLSVLALICASSTQSSAQTDRPLSNQDINKLVKVGLTADVIIKKFEESPSAYNLSVDGLTLLAQNRVPNEVIKAMHGAAARQQGRTPLSPSAGNRSGSTSVGSGPSPPSAPSASYPHPPYRGCTSGMVTKYTCSSRAQCLPSDRIWWSITPFVKRSLSCSSLGVCKGHFENQQSDDSGFGIGRSHSWRSGLSTALCQDLEDAEGS
jgi:hypothetical protein